MYAYVNMLGRNDLINCTNKLTLFAGKESNRCKPATMQRKERNHCRNNANDSFGKGFCRTRSSTAS